MKRDSVVTCLLLVNACLLVYVAVLVWQKPSLYDIDARIDYWHKFYLIERMRGARTTSQDEAQDQADVHATVGSAATYFVPTPNRDENAAATDPSTEPSNERTPRFDEE